jgi:hypothetical protein
MEILLSRLEDEPASQTALQTVSGRDLEHWALAQPGGDTLNLKIQVHFRVASGILTLVRRSSWRRNTTSCLRSAPGRP